MTRAREDTEETLYAELCQAKDLQSRESCSQKLNDFLSRWAGHFGVSHESLTRRFRRGKHADPESAAAAVMAAIQTRRLDILRRIAGFGSGNWRDDIKAYLRKSDLPGLDDLIIVGGRECDDLWAEIMAHYVLKQVPETLNPDDWDNLWAQISRQKFFRPDPKNRSTDWAGRRWDAVHEVIGTMLTDSRSALTAAAARPGDEVARPVCIGYCCRAARNLLRGEEIREARIVPYDEARPAKTDADDDMTGQSDDGHVVDDDIFIGEPYAVSDDFEESDGEVVVVATTLDETIDQFFTLSSESQMAIVEAVWKTLKPSRREALWLSRIFQQRRAGAGFPKLESPCSDVALGGRIDGTQAAGKLGITREAFHARVNRAAAAFGKCLVKEVRRAVLAAESAVSVGGQNELSATGQRAKLAPGR